MLPRNVGTMKNLKCDEILKPFEMARYSLAMVGRDGNLFTAGTLLRSALYIGVASIATQDCHNWSDRGTGAGCNRSMKTRRMRTIQIHLHLSLLPPFRQCLAFRP